MTRGHLASWRGTASNGTKIALLIDVPSRSRRSRFAFLAGIIGTTLFVMTVAAVASGAAREEDERIRRRLQKIHSPALDTLSAAATPLLSPLLLIAGCLAVGFANRKRGARVWLPIATAPFMAMTAGRLFTSTLPKQYAPRPEKGKWELSFPSGHTTGATAEALTIGCVLQRNGIIGSGASAAMALIPLVEGLNRLYRDRHWTSDIVAGLSAGTAIAAILCLASAG